MAGWFPGRILSHLAEQFIGCDATREAGWDIPRIIGGMPPGAPTGTPTRIVASGHLEGFSVGWLLGSKERLSLGGLVGVPKQTSAEMATDH